LNPLRFEPDQERVELNPARVLLVDPPNLLSNLRKIVILLLNDIAQVVKILLPLQELGGRGEPAAQLNRHVKVRSEAEPSLILTF